MNKGDFDTFINELCIECGIMDSRVARNVYNSLVRMTIKNIKLRNSQELPQIGIFSKSKNNHMNIVRYNVNKGTKENILSESYVRFKLDRNFKLMCRDY